MHGEYESLIPRDDLALALMNIGRVEQIAAPPPHQEFRAPCPDRIVTPPPSGGFARFVLRQLRKRQDVAPDLPGGCNLVAVGTDPQGNGQ